MKTPIFCGASVAIVTPFDRDGSVNYAKLRELVEMQIEGGTAAITICGTTGESSTLTDEEHRRTISKCLEFVNGRIPVIAGTGSNDTEYAVDLSRFAAAEGTSALLLVTPYYNKCTQNGLKKHMLTIIEAAGIPSILYNVPSRTGVSFTADTYEALSAHPLVNGVKEASSNFDLICETMHRCGDNLNIWSGNDAETVAIMAMGGKGVISVVSNVAPKVMSSICALMNAGKTAEAAKLANSIYPMSRDLFIETNPIPAKTAMNLMGMEVGGLRMPLCEMAPANEEKLRASMAACGLL
ncbi:MAG: 4-hydroxy-tetrahydrodipicolinate synthase [Clostridia bacterium]|nr:4-hydroxy-tetrahydrodipicolinate synthase [Clostridia bacterium]